MSEGWKLLFGVSQGSLLGPLPLLLYTPTLSHLIGWYSDVNFHIYVNLSHKNPADAFDKLNRYLQDVKEWMSPSKTQPW